MGDVLGIYPNLYSEDHRDMGKVLEYHNESNVFSYTSISQGPEIGAKGGEFLDRPR